MIILRFFLLAFSLIFSGNVLPGIKHSTAAVAVQRQFEIYSMTKNDGIAAKIEVSPHPNATAGLLIANVASDMVNLVSYGLYSESGNLIMSDNILQTHSRIFLRSLPSAIYYLRFFKSGKEVKAFKIVKNR